MIHGIFYKATQARDFRARIENHHSDLVLSSSQQQIVSASFAQVWLAQSMEKKHVLSKPPQLVSMGSPPKVVISAWASLYNREELAQALDISDSVLTTLTASDLILR